MKLRRHCSDSGFTLIEVLVVIGIFALFAGLGLFLSVDSLRGDAFRSERDIVLSIMQKARSRAMSNIEEMPHGVRIENAPARYVLFQGAAFDPAAATNEIFEARPNIVNDGPKDFIFAQPTGAAAAASTTLSDGVKTVTISVNAEGQINW